MSGYAGRSIARDDAVDIAEMMVMAGRAPAASRWVDWMVADIEEASLDNLI